jgi:two-component system cell cycle sensor histidine kinase/response regulator CckA
MIHHRLPAGAADQEYDDLCQSVGHAAALIHELWESRATSAAGQPVDMNRVITLASDTLARVAGDRILLRRDLSVAPVPIIADVADIERILLNLVLNARDAMPEGGVLTIETRVSLQSPDSDEVGTPSCPRARLTVSDTGRGMTQKVKASMFEPYFTATGGVTGLGSSSIATTVIRVGGTLSVGSELDGRTCVTVYLPLAALPRS